MPRSSRGQMLPAVLIVATVVHALGNMVQQSIPVMGPRLIDDLQISTAQFGALIGAVATGNVLLLSVSGYVADRLNLRRVLAAATAACGLGTMAVGLSVEYPVTLALLVVVGMAVGTTISAGGGAVFASAPPHRRGLMVSIRQTGLPFGGILAAVLVPALLHVANWRSVFLVEGGLFILGAVCVGRTPFPDAVSGASQARVPLSRDELRSVLVLGLLGLTLGGTQWGFVGYLSLQMTDRFGLSFGLASVVFLVTQVAGLISRVLLGWMSDRRGGDRMGVLLVLSLVGAASTMALTVLPEQSAVVSLLIASGVAGFCLLGWNGVLITAFAESASPQHTSLAIGIGLTFVGVGMMVAPVAIGLAGIARSPSLFLGLTGMLLVACFLLVLIARAELREELSP